VAKDYFTKISLGEYKNISEKAAQKDFFVFAYDEILVCEPNKVVARKHVMENEPFFQQHFGLRSVVPLTVLSQYNVSLAQWYLNKFFPEEHMQFSPKQMRNVKIYDFIDPGADIETTMKISNNDDNYEFRFCSKVNNKRVFVAQLIFQKKV